MQSDEIRDLVLAQARLPLSAASVSDVTNLDEAGLTSLARINMIIAIEERYEITFDDELLTRENFKNIQSISRLVKNLVSKGQLLVCLLAGVLSEYPLIDLVPTAV